MSSHFYSTDVFSNTGSNLKYANPTSNRKPNYSSYNIYVSEKQRCSRSVTRIYQWNLCCTFVDRSDIILDLFKDFAKAFGASQITDWKLAALNFSATTINKYVSAFKILSITHLHHLQYFQLRVHILTASTCFIICLRTQTNRLSDVGQNNLPINLPSIKSHSSFKVALEQCLLENSLWESKTSIEKDSPTDSRVQSLD